jgi:plasmid stabilization system protein ParE
VKSVRFLDVAQAELDEAVAYYDSESAGLGSRFLIEVLATLDRIASYPEAWPSFGPDARRCLTRRFPYGIVYQVLSKGILIIAVAHLHREPGYWRERAERNHPE